MQAVSTSREPPACFLQSNMHWRLNTGGPRSRRRAFILCARAGLSMGEAWRKPARAYRLTLPAALFYTKRKRLHNGSRFRLLKKCSVGALCAPVLVSCMSSFPGNALPRQASGRTMFAPTVSTMGKMVFRHTETIAQRQSLPFLFGIHFLISAVSTMNFTLPVLPAGRPEKVW